MAVEIRQCLQAYGSVSFLGSQTSFLQPQMTTTKRKFSQWMPKHPSPTLPPTIPHLLKLLWTPIFKVSKPRRGHERSALREDTGLRFRSRCPQMGRKEVLTYYLWLWFTIPKFSLYNEREYRTVSDIKTSLRHVQGPHNRHTYHCPSQSVPCTNTLQSPTS